MPKQIGWSNESNLLYTISSQISRLAGIIATSGGGGGGGGTITGGGASGQVTFWNGATSITGSNNLFWNNASSILDLSSNAGGQIRLNDNDANSAFSMYAIATIANNFAIVNRSSTGAYVGDVWGVVTSSTTNSFQRWFTGGVQKMQLYNTGNLVLQNGGTFTDDLTNRLQVGGSIKATQDSTINSISIGLGNSSISTNTRVGVTTLNAITTGGFNTAIGFDSQRFTTTGGSNTSLGYYAARQNQGGGSNTAIGRSALQDNQSGNENTALGNNAAFSNTSASFNSVIGSEALYNNTTGASNVAFGYRAGRYLTGGATVNTISNSSIFIGAETKANADNETNQIVIGHQAIGAGSNSVTLGNTSITKTIIAGNLLLGSITDTTERLQVTGDVKITGKLALTVVTNRQTVNYSLVLADNGKLVETNVGAANTITVPPNSSITFPIGTKIDIAQYGAGQTTIVPGIGVTVRSAGGALKLSAQYSGATIVKIGTDEWYLFGDITV